jgi:heptosyltransferase-3
MIVPRKALFIQLRRIGDVLMCTPSIRAFKKHYADCKLDFLTELPAVLEGNPFLDEIIFVDRSREYNAAYQYKLIKKIRSARYDLVVDFFANPRSAYYAFLSGAPTRLSYGYGHRRWAYNLVPSKTKEPLYAAADRLKLLEAIDISSSDCRLDFFPTEKDRLDSNRIIPDDGRPVISLSPVSRRRFNRWPLESYSKLADLLIDKLNAHVIILAGPGEENSAITVSEMMNAEAIVPKLGTLSLLGAIFERVDLHVGNDNGPKHIAVACGAPTVTIFGPHSPISWTYPDPSRHEPVCPSELCNDCGRRKHRCKPECIEGISVDTVWDKVVKMVERLPNFDAITKR